MNYPRLKRTVLVVVAVLLAVVSFALLLAAVSPRPLSPFAPTQGLPPSLSVSPAVITWTPTSTEQTVSPGETKTVSMSFVSSKNIRRASVRASPELAALVHTDPVSFERIRKGELKTLTLIVAPSASSTLGTITGSIQLQRGKVEKDDPDADEDDRREAGKLLPQALKVDVNVWPTVKDTSGFFEVKYPPSWTEAVVGSQYDSRFKPGSKVSVTSLKSPGGSLLNILPEGEFDYELDVTEANSSQVSIDGRTAARFDLVDNQGAMQFTRIEISNTHDFRIEFWPKQGIDIPIMEKILSTIKLF